MSPSGAQFFRRQLVRRCMALLALVCWTQSALAGSSAPHPPFQLGRYDDDDSYLEDESLRTERDDMFKHLPVGDTVRLSLGGELRERIDRNNAARFGIGTSDDTYALQRLLAHADLHLGSAVRVFVQLGREDAFGKRGSLAPSDRDRGDVQNAFIDFIVDPDHAAAVRVGRQELTLNATQRFVSVREGPNVRQSFDGASLRWKAGPFDMLAFAAHPVRYRPGDFDDGTDRSQRFLGLAITTAHGSGTWQGYALELDRTVTGSAGGGNERRHTIGFRTAANDGSFDHDVEVAGQWGRSSNRSIRAWAMSAQAGWRLEEEWKPRIGLTFDAGSGERGGRRSERFDSLFPKGAYFNESASVSWSNLILIRTGLTVRPRADLAVGISVGKRWRQTGDDAVYVQPATPIAASLSNRRRFVGDLYQADASWQATRYVALTVQALHQSAGSAIRMAGGRSIDFLMLIGQARF